MANENTPSLDLFYPSPDDELGIGKSDVTEYDRQRYFHNYEVVEELLFGHSRPSDLICDLGSGSGYGAHNLASRRRYVIGVEPVDLPRAYAVKHYPKIRFQNDLEGADVVVSVGSLRRFSQAELRSASSKAHAVIIATPLLNAHKTDLVLTSFREPDDVFLMMKKNGFHPCEVRIELGVTFVTGDVGAMFYGAFSRD